MVNNVHLVRVYEAKLSGAFLPHDDVGVLVRIWQQLQQELPKLNLAWGQCYKAFSPFLSGATTFGIMTFSIMTLCIMNLTATLSISNTQLNDTRHKNLVSLCWVSCFSYCYAHCHYSECHYVKCHYAECRGALYSLMLVKYAWVFFLGTFCKGNSEIGYKIEKLSRKKNTSLFWSWRKKVLCNIDTWSSRSRKKLNIIIFIDFWNKKIHSLNKKVFTLLLIKSSRMLTDWLNEERLEWGIDI